jgi:hypothetical protein
VNTGSQKNKERTRLDVAAAANVEDATISDGFRLCSKSERSAGAILALVSSPTSTAPTFSLHLLR